MADDTFHFRIISLRGIERAFTYCRISGGRAGGIEKKVELREITKQEAGSKKCIGEGMGRDIVHCIYLGMKYCEDFTEKAKWYSLDPENEEFKKLKEKQPHSICIGFYGEK